MGKIQCPGLKTRGLLVVAKFSVGCKCHNHDAFKELSDSDSIYKTSSHDFSIKELHWLKAKSQKTNKQTKKTKQIIVVLVVVLVMWLKKEFQNQS